MLGGQQFFHASYVYVSGDVHSYVEPLPVFRDRIIYLIFSFYGFVLFFLLLHFIQVIRNSFQLKKYIKFNKKCQHFPAKHNTSQQEEKK